MQHVEILGLLGVRAATVVNVAVHQRAAVVWSEQPLVRVDDETVGPFDAVELMTNTRSAQRRQPVRTIDVEPDVLAVAKSRDAVEIVDHTEVGGSARRDDGEHALAIGRRQTSQHRCHRFTVEASALVRGG